MERGDDDAIVLVARLSQDGQAGLRHAVECGAEEDLVQVELLPQPTLGKGHQGPPNGDQDDFDLPSDTRTVGFRLQTIQYQSGNITG